MATETQLRQSVVAAMQGWIGLQRNDRSHQPILDTYNSHKPLARGYPIQPTDDYCAATVSAAAIKAGVPDLYPLEVSVPKIVAMAQQRGIWVENDAHVPQPADWIIYDWGDSGKGDNTGGPDHVGLVERVANGTIYCIEGNTSGGKVARTTHPVNGLYIRGFVCPDFSKVADKPAEQPAPADVPIWDDQGSTCTVELPVLHYGSTGEFVETLQQLLNYWASEKLGLDANFGKLTEAAVNRYKTRHGLNPDGKMDAETWRLLLR